jgi:ABC-type lipoprotein release transport system permease subunit
VLAAVLALLGIYGLFSWLVALKERELAIRLTLGARPYGIGWTIVRQGMLLAMLGLGAGWLLVRSADSLLSRVLFEIAPGDLSSTMSAALLLLGGALLTCLVPAWRAMRVNPIDGLRSE